jgi:hypothetical protein
MPGPLLLFPAPVMCTHGGQAKPTAPNPRVTVMGQPTVALPAQYMVAGCTFVPPAGNGPCVTILFTPAARVLSNGMPLLLVDGTALCQPTLTPPIAPPTQTRVIAT